MLEFLFSLLVYLPLSIVTALFVVWNVLLLVASPVALLLKYPVNTNKLIIRIVLLVLPIPLLIINAGVAVKLIPALAFFVVVVAAIALLANLLVQLTLFDKMRKRGSLVGIDTVLMVFKRILKETVTL